jgi:ABC-2 type transport system ATP-binding protein
MNSSQPIIEVKQLFKRYKGSDEEALKGISLSIERGENFGLLGPNAAGKTTLISILCGLLKFNNGEVIVNGIDVGKTPRKICPIIGLIPQEIALYPNLTLKENLLFFGRMQGLSGKKLREKIDYFIDIVKLDPHQSKLASRCSGGIRRRANLIAGLIHEPQIIFLDEPTLGTDAQSQYLIGEFIKELNKKGATIIYTTHYIKEAEYMCNRVMIIDNGNIVTSGAPDQLIREQNCSDLGQVFIKLTGKELRD